MEKVVKVTYSGRLIDVFNPRVEDIDFNDVAHHLANIERFDGGTHKKISVARHSLNVARIVYEKTNDPTTTLYALLHDAHEYIIGDVSTPVKEAVRILASGRDIFRILSERADKAIFTAAGLKPHVGWDIYRSVKWADKQALRYEAENFLLEGGVDLGIPKEYDGDMPHTRWSEYDKEDFLNKLRFLQFIISEEQYDKTA